jgi:hypothetical protein
MVFDVPCPKPDVLSEKANKISGRIDILLLEKVAKTA